MHISNAALSLETGVKCAVTYSLQTVSLRD